MYYQKHTQRFLMSFNRYMVECEFARFTIITRIRNVLIDTWWNVNTNALPVCGL